MDKLTNLEKLLLVTLAIAMLLPFFVYPKWQAYHEKPPETYEEKLVYQFKAGDDVVPDYYQLWNINGKEHLVVMPRR